MGDLNSRCGSLPDYVSMDQAEHVCTLPDDYVCDNELPRTSQDNGINSNGRSLIELCKASGLRIANGRVCGDTGRCTYVGSRGSSLVDLVLINGSYYICLLLFLLMIKIFLSDHCTVNFSMYYEQPEHIVNDQQSDNNQHARNITYKFAWNNENIHAYDCLLSSAENVDKLTQLTHALNADSTVSDIDNSVSGFKYLIK